MVKKAEHTDFISLFKEELFIPHLKARTKEEVLVEMAELFLIQKKVKDKEILLEMLHQRESLGSTGIGKGIAIPHSRSLLVNKLEVAIGRSVKGVSFDTIDKKPAHLFFLIIAPPQDPGNQYLVTLGRVALISQNLARNKQYLEPKTPQEMIQLIRDAEDKIR